MRFSAKLCLAVASAALLAGSAAAQQIDRIVAFGDSYADDGNFFQLVPAAYTAQARQAYPNGRFSNGTNFVDTMGQILGVPIDNFAIGGAFTGNGNINGVGGGFVTEYQSFLAGGGPAAFPRVTGTFDANDLAVVSIGGNDARAYERSLGLNPTSAQIAGLIAGVPAQAQLRVAEAATGLNALVGAGAQNITFLAGDVGRLPEVQGRPVAAVGSAYAAAFNTGIQAQLATIAGQGVTVNYLDLNRIGDVVQANLGAFGLVSAGACPATCAADPSQFDRYLFYIDQVHLSSRGFQIVGQYAVRQLEAPQTFEAQTDLGLSAASGFGQLMSGRLDLGGGGDDPLSFYLVGTTAAHDVTRSSSSLAYDYDSVGVAAGAEFNAGPATAGVIVAYSKPKTDFTSATGRTRAEAWHVGGYAGFEMGGAFVEGYAGYGWLDYDFRRDAVIDEIEAETDGTSLVAGGEAGFLFGVMGVTAGPVIGVNYARAKLDGYAERGDPVLTLNVSDQCASELLGFAGVEAQFDTGVGPLAIEPYVKLLAEKQLDGNARTIRYSNTASPTIVNSFDSREESDDVYGRVEGGVSIGLSSAIALQLQASATLEHPHHDEVSGFLGVKVGF